LDRRRYWTTIMPALVAGSHVRGPPSTFPLAKARF
jgi:hypothetical protein